MPYRSSSAGSGPDSAAEGMGGIAGMGGMEGTGMSEARCMIWPARRSACFVASAAISRDLVAVSEKISLDFFAVSDTSTDDRLAASSEYSCDSLAGEGPSPRGQADQKKNTSAPMLAYCPLGTESA